MQSLELFLVEAGEKYGKKQQVSNNEYTMIIVYILIH